MAEFRFKPKEKGFTLAEVLVVVIIIGILVAIAVPVFSNNITRANRTVVEANLKTIEAAIMQYGAANEGAIPKKDDDLSTKDCAVVASYTMSIIEENFGCIDDTECYNEIWQITYDHCRDSMFN